MQTESDNQITRYLLGELPDAEMEAFEESYFADAALFGRIVEAESKLVDDYARGRLSNDVRTRFERTFASRPAVAERVRFAESLTARLDAAEPAITPPVRESLATRIAQFGSAFRLAAAFGALLLAVVAIWLLISRDRQSPEEVAVAPVANIDTPAPGAVPEPLSTPMLGPLPTQPADPVKTPTPRPTASPAGTPAQRTATLALAIGGVRGGSGSGVPVLTLSAGTAEARLSVDLGEAVYQKYRLSLQTAAGREIASQTVAKPRGTTLSFTVRADRFAIGDHILTVAGVDENGPAEPIGRSLFRVRR